MCAKKNSHNPTSTWERWVIYHLYSLIEWRWLYWFGSLVVTGWWIARRAQGTEFNQLLSILLIITWLGVLLTCYAKTVLRLIERAHADKRPRTEEDEEPGPE